MTCDSARPLLSPLLDRELPARMKSAMDGHLSRCRSCSRELEALRGLGALLRSMTRRPLPAGFLARLKQRRAEAAPTPPWLYAPNWLGFAMAALLAGLVIYRANAPEPGDPAFAGKAALPPPPAPKISRAGEPLHSRKTRPSYTNERLRKMLQDEGERMGIQAYNPREEPRPASFLGPSLGEPGTREQAEAAIRRLAAMRRAVEEASGRPKSVPIAGRTAPVLAAPEEGGASLLEPSPAPAQAHAGTSWSGDYSGGNEGNQTLRDEKSWRRLWRRLSKEPPPPVDFKRQQVVVVFLGLRPSGGYGVEIVEVAPTAAQLVIRFRERTPSPEQPAPPGPTSPYALRVIERSDLPVRFEPQP